MQKTQQARSPVGQTAGFKRRKQATSVESLKLQRPDLLVIKTFFLIKRSNAVGI
jgi:hypothetical protein